MPSSCDFSKLFELVLPTFIGKELATLMLKSPEAVFVFTLVAQELWISGRRRGAGGEWHECCARTGASTGHNGRGEETRDVDGVS